MSFALENLNKSVEVWNLQLICPIFLVSCTVFPVDTCFAEEACIKFCQSVHYVNAVCKSCENFTQGLTAFNIASLDYRFCVQYLYMSMDQYLHGLFLLANDPAPEVRKLVSSCLLWADELHPDDLSILDCRCEHY